MNMYLYSEENIKPVSFKKRLDIHYRSIYSDVNKGETFISEAYISNSTSVFFTLTPHIMIADELALIRDPRTGKTYEKQVSVGNDHVHINITLGESHSMVETFMVIFQHLLCYYLYNLEAVKATFLEFLPKLVHLPYLLQQRKILEEKSNAPQIFSRTLLTLRISSLRTSRRSASSLASQPSSAQQTSSTTTSRTSRVTQCRSCLFPLAPGSIFASVRRHNIPIPG